mmetsp:Transcript_144160/g.268597  ORF Transcript_144160/g.268597 Transcript_144160/m.268597 type:complete len:498 (-) Transcript_144160:8-1501(-)
MKTWLCALFLATPFGDALVREAAKQRLQVQTNPSTLNQLCETEVDELQEALTACEDALAKHSVHTERAIAESRGQREEANLEVQRLQAVVHEKQEKLAKIEAENDELHDRLIAALDNLQPSYFTVVRAKQIPNMSSEAVDSWMKCEDEKTQLELQVSQCRARLTAEQSRQDMRRDNHDQLEANAKGNARMLKEHIALLDEQIAQAQRRQERLRRQVQQLEGVALSQQATEPAAGSNASRNRLWLGATPNVANKEKIARERIEAAKKVLQAAKTVRAEAAAKHQAALAKSERREAKASRSQELTESRRTELEVLRANMSRQNDTFHHQRKEAESAMAHAAEAKAQAGILREEHAALANASREAFMKAFLIDNERSQAKQAYKDAVVEARIASRRWEQEQREQNIAAYNLTRLDAEKKRLEWRLKSAENAEAQAADQAETAQKRLKEAEVQLEVEEQRVREAQRALEAAQHGSAAARGSPWQSALLSAAFLVLSITRTT